MKLRATIALNGKTATGIPVPDDVVTALGAGQRSPPIRQAHQFVDRIPYNHKSAYVRWIESAEKDQTRQRRILEAITMLRAGRTQR